MWTILLRAGIQRTYGTKGFQCVKNLVFDSSSQITMPSYGYVAAIVYLTFQFLVTVVSILAFIPWLTSKAPVSQLIY